MAIRALSTLLSVLALLRSTTAQIGPDPNWINPDGSKVDFTTTFAAGNTVTLSWKALNNSKSDLYLTHWTPSDYPYYYQIATGVDISVAGTLNWYIDVPTSEVSNNNSFVLRFYPSGSLYGPLQFVQRDSPGFYLSGGVKSGGAGTGSTATTTNSQSSSTTSATGGVTSSQASSTTSSASTSQTSVTGSSVTTSAPSSQSSSLATITTTNASGNVVTATVTTSAPTSTDVAGSSSNQSSSSSSGGLSVGAQAGIGVGVGIVVIALFVAGCFFGRRFGIGRTLRGNGYRNEPEGFPMKDKKDSPYTDHDASLVTNKAGFPVAEAPSENETLISRKQPYDQGNRSYHNARPPWAEVTGNNSQPIEKSGAMVRPGVHELGGN